MSETITPSGRCRAAACAAVAVVIVLDFLSAYPTIERIVTKTEQLQVETIGANSNSLAQISGYPEILLPVDTSYLRQIGEKREYPVDSGDSGQKVHIFHSPSNTRMVVDLVDGSEGLFGYSGKITRDISDKQMMHSQQLASIKRDRENLFTDMAGANQEAQREDSFITEGNELLIHNIGTGSTVGKKLQITVQKLPPLTLFAKLLATRSRELDLKRLAKGNPKITNVFERLENRLTTLLKTEDDQSSDERPKKRVKERITFNTIKAAIQKLYNPSSKDPGHQLCSGGKRRYKDDEDLAIFFTLYKPRSMANPIMYHLNKFEAVPFEIVHIKGGDEFVLNITEREFDLGGRKTIVYTHGWRGTPYLKAMLPLIQNLISYDYNVIVSDYRKISDTYANLDYSKDYYTSESSRRKRSNDATIVEMLGYNNVVVGRHPVPYELSHVLAEVTKQISPKDVHMIGHSLGAHISGEAAHIYKSITKGNQQIGRITGIDPANFCFSSNISPAERLDKTDADFVDIWHTSKVGSWWPSGHKDYWVAGGRKQPKCQPKCTTFFCRAKSSGFGLYGAVGYSEINFCGHKLAQDYFVNSVKPCKHRYKAIPVSSAAMYKFLESDNDFEEFFGEAATRTTPEESAKFDELWNTHGREEMGFFGSSSHSQDSATSQTEYIPIVSLEDDGGSGGFFDHDAEASGNDPEVSEARNDFNLWEGSSNYIVPVTDSGSLCF